MFSKEKTVIYTIFLKLEMKCQYDLFYDMMCSLWSMWNVKCQTQCDTLNEVSSFNVADYFFHFLHHNWQTKQLFEKTFFLNWNVHEIGPRIDENWITNGSDCVLCSTKRSDVKAYGSKKGWKKFIENKTELRETYE